MLSKCRRCGQVFKATKYLRSYCSEECRDTAHENPIYIKKCDECGKEFETSNRRRKYCSHECYLGRNANEIAESRSITFEKICERCGKAYVTGCRKQRYCSDKCRYACKSKQRNAKPKKSHSLEEKVEAAARLGISYGMYCAIKAGHLKPPKGMLLNDI